MASQPLLEGDLEDFPEWADLVDKVCYCGVMGFASTVPFYLIGLSGWSIAGYALLAAMVAVAISMELAAEKLLDAGLERAGCETQLKKMQGWKDYPARAFNVDLCGVPRSLYTWVMSVPLHMEVPQTMLAAGTLHRIWRDDAAARWRSSWLTVPFVGSLLGDMGQANVLAVLTIFNQVCCAYLFLVDVGRARKCLSDMRQGAGHAQPHNRSMFFTRLTDAADLGNLGPVAVWGAQLRATEKLEGHFQSHSRAPREEAPAAEDGAGEAEAAEAGKAKASGEEGSSSSFEEANGVHQPGSFDHGRRFQFGVALGTVPRLYLKVSMLMDDWTAIHEDPVALLFLALALASGFFGIATALPDWKKTVEHWDDQQGRGEGVRGPLVCNLAALVFTVLLTGVNVVRLVGACNCDSHLYNLSDGCLPSH